MPRTPGYKSPSSPELPVPNPQVTEGFLVEKKPGLSLVPGMSEISKDAHEGPLPPIVAIGGLFTVKQYYPLYSKLLRRSTTPRVPGHERFVAPLHRGIGPVADIRRDINEAMLRLYERLGERMYGVGHSLGGLLLTWAVLDNPDIFAGASCIAGAQDGIRKHTLATTGLRLLAGNPAEARLLNHDSAFMEEHRTQVSEAWPAHVPLDLVSTSFDGIIVPPQGLGLQPRGQQPSKRLVVSSWHAAAPMTKHIMRKMPEGVMPLTSAAVVEHVNIVRSGVVLNHIDGRRRAIAGLPGSESAAAS